MAQGTRHHVRPTVSNCGLQILLRALGLDSTCSGYSRGFETDTVLLSIDFEKIENLMGGFSQSDDSQVGIAILNIKDLLAPQLKKNIISTYNLVTGSPSYISKASRKFLFGKSIIIKPTKILKNIQSIIPRDRPIILVGHNVNVELRVLTRLGFDLSSLNADIIDTASITDEVFGGAGYSLREVLTSLNCPFNNLHSGGNDANFTLRASLLLAVKGCVNHGHAMISILSMISTEPIPYRVDPEVKAAKKKEKRAARSRKQQSKFWSIDKQSEIRAERAARRMSRQEGILGK